MRFLTILFVFLFPFSSNMFSQCVITNFNVSVGSCTLPGDVYNVDGEVQFTNAPGSGTLIVEVNNGTTIYDTIINLPFVSPQVWSISGIPSDGLAITVSSYFSADPGCTAGINSIAPNSCTCIANAGSFSGSITGDGTNNYVLCFGDQIDLSSNLDYTSPADENIGGITYDPGIAYLAYSCPPSVFPPTPLYDNFGVQTDSCLIGLLSFGVDYSDVNTFGAPPNFGPSYANNTIYYVPTTMYSVSGGYYAVSNNGGPYCFDMGAPFTVTYLPPVSLSEEVDSLSGTVVVTVSGGYPEIFNGQYSVVNNGLGTLSGATVDSSGGSFEISGLLGGSVWDYTVLDGNGCSYGGTDTLPGSLGINDNFMEYTLSPNPARESINLQFTKHLVATVNIINQLGEIVVSDDINGESFNLNIAELESGLYFVRIVQAEFRAVTQRFIKID